MATNVSYNCRTFKGYHLAGASVIAAIRSHERIHGRVESAREVVIRGAGAMHADQIRTVAAAAAARIGVVIETGSALPAAGVGLVLDHVRRGVVLARR